MDRLKGPVLMGQSRDAVGIRITIPCNKDKDAFNSPVRLKSSFRGDQSLLLRSQSSKDYENKLTSTLKKRRYEGADQQYNSASRLNELLEADKMNKSVVFNVSESCMPP